MNGADDDDDDDERGERVRRRESEGREIYLSTYHTSFLSVDTTRHDTKRRSSTRARSSTRSLLDGHATAASAP